MTPFARKILGVAIDQIREALREIEADDVEQLPPPRRAPRKASPIVKAMRAEAGEIAINPKIARKALPAREDGHVVLVCIDGRPPRLALVVDEQPKPGFKTIRLQDGRSTSKYSPKEHRVLESEIRRDATEEERSTGRLKSSLRGAA